MTQKDTSGPAFPCDRVLLTGGVVCSTGITIRDYFAAKAMQGMFARGGAPEEPELYAAAAYLVADAMLKERAK